ncbi:MAG: hypothetical protein NVV73_05315 [Cellvibrionaceae bacterium]|nr:hypothetical protein [Cellvibrionaceae bacterium]
MSKQLLAINQMLPHGEMLRGFLEQPFLQKTDLKEALRKRGVFNYSNEKSDSIPILIMTVLSPSEFDSLCDSQSSREDNPKKITQILPWSSDKNLIDALPSDLSINNLIDNEYANYKVVDETGFIPVNNDPNYLRLDFGVERQDLGKNWSSTKSHFHGSIEMKRVVDKEEVKIIFTHTSNETKQVATKATSKIVGRFKSDGFVLQNVELQKITFDRFTNAKRIQFLLELSVELTSNHLDFEEIVDLELAPDHDQILPENMRWMTNKIDDLKLNGKLLHETFFVNERESHPYIFLHRLDARYSFDVRGVTGKCVVAMHFPDGNKESRGKSELELNIKSISFSGVPKGASKKEIREFLLDDLESQKSEKYVNYING